MIFSRVCSKNPIFYVRMIFMLQFWKEKNLQNVIFNYCTHIVFCCIIFRGFQCTVGTCVISIELRRLFIYLRLCSIGSFFWQFHFRGSHSMSRLEINTKIRRNSPSIECQWTTYFNAGNLDAVSSYFDCGWRRKSVTSNFTNKQDQVMSHRITPRLKLLLTFFGLA